VAVIDQSAARFVRRQNVRHYRLLLDQNEAERKKIQMLLTEEQQKQTDAGDPPDYDQMR
jgi:hypothetical protein